MIHSRKTAGVGGFLSHSEGRECVERSKMSVLAPAASRLTVSC